MIGASIDKDKTFDFEIMIQNREGDIPAILLNKNPYTKKYQLQIDSIDLMIDSNGLLKDANSNLAVYRKDGQDYYIYVEKKENTSD